MFICEVCSKACKSKGGLKIHTRKHSGDSSTNKKSKEENFTLIIVEEQLKSTTEKLSQESNIFSALLSTALKPYLENGFPESFKMKLLEELNTNVKIKSRETYYASYYTFIVNTTTIQLQGFSYRLLRVLLMKVADLLWVNLKRNLNDKEKNVEHHPVTEKEMESLQYLGGYVLHNLHTKLIKTNKNGKHDVAISILEANKDSSDGSKNLISSLRRGGLWTKIPLKARKITLEQVALMFFC